MARIKKGQRIKADDLNKMMQGTQTINNMQGVGDTSVSHGPAGITVGKAASRGQRAPTVAANVLGHNQGTRDTDRWTRGASSGGKGVTEYDWTDFFYDDTNHALYGRQRVKTYDANGALVSIAAESEPVIIVQFVECEAQP